jgi:hypothetical protein
VRKYLIVVRAGDRSLHQTWLTGRCQRDFDIFVSYYGQVPEQHRTTADFYEHEPGPRWPAIHRLCERERDLLARYHHVAFAADDLAAKTATWNSLFDHCARYQLDLAQPGIVGPASFAITRARRDCVLRYTNFVEIMCPVFQTTTLDRLRQTFGESVSGWGLDFLWAHRSPCPDYRLAVIDAAVVRHTRPIGQGNLYDTLKRSSVDPREELERVLAKHQVPARPIVEHGRIRSHDLMSRMRFLPAFWYDRAATKGIISQRLREIAALP